jgi:RNA polymerase sigma-70 factor (ECF subfamily)
MCRDPEDARDILQETMLAMARGVAAFRGESSISTWLWTIARSFCLKKRRRSKFAPAIEEPLDGPVAAEARAVEDPGRAPDEALAARELGAAVEQAIGELEPMYREVLVLRDVEGLTAPEVAQVLGLKVDAVKSRLHRARVAVRNRLAPLLAPAAAPPPAGTAGTAGPAGPACPDVLTLFSRHLEGEISADLCAEMERHLAGCLRCRAACDSLKQTLSLCRSVAAPEVPGAVQASIRTAIRELLAAGVLAPARPAPAGRGGGSRSPS